MNPFGSNFVHRQTDTQKHSKTHTNCNENVTPLRFCGGVKIAHTHTHTHTHTQIKFVVATVTQTLANKKWKYSYQDQQGFPVF